VRRRVAKVASVMLPLVLLACVLVTVVRSGTAPAGASQRQAAHAAMTARYYVGVREPGAPQSWAPVARFERASGTRVGLVLDYTGWRQPFPAAAARTARRHGAALVVQMEPWGASLRGLARGEYAGYLRTFARQVRSFGGPVVIGFGHEMNGPWYPWGSASVPPQVFVAAWRRVVTTFRAVGADNVTWLWTVHHNADAARLRAYWPGSAFVTWVGIDGYYEFGYDNFALLFGRTAAAVRTFTHKPILASESAVGPGAHDVPAKIANMFDGVRADNFLGLVWFDVAQHDPPYHQDWRIVGRPADLAAFERGAGRLRDQALGRAAGTRDAAAPRPSELGR
jgi:mannan endo-1,4-beta-mannosidase